MKYAFTRHCEQRLLGRNLNKETVIFAIENTDSIQVRFNDEFEAFHIFDDRTLKVVYVESKNIRRVITTYWLE